MNSLFFQRAVGRGRIPLPRCSQTFQRPQQVKTLAGTIRWSSNTSNAPKAPTISPKALPKKASYPERLLVYHAGTGRIVFLGCLKVTTIFIFSFFSFVVAPSRFYAETEPPWVAVGVLLSGIIPMVSVAYMLGPFVAYIHLRLPAYARHSQEMLMRYTKNLPNDAALDITTMNFIGKPRVTHLKISDIYPVKERFGFVNYAGDVEAINSKLPWYLPKAVRQFGMYSNTSKIMGGAVWENVARRISRK